MNKQPEIWESFRFLPPCIRHIQPTISPPSEPRRSFVLPATGPTRCFPGALAASQTRQASISVQLCRGLDPTLKFHTQDSGSPAEEGTGSQHPAP